MINVDELTDDKLDGMASEDLKELTWIMPYDDVWTALKNHALVINVLSKRVEELENNVAQLISPIK